MHAVRHPVIERTERGVECDDTGAREAHGTRMFTKFTMLRALTRAPARGEMLGLDLKRARKRIIASA
jgi:hypothetical protein